ncbi:pentatricopeptide repeat-containing protein [Acrasis kona]|uniref:Pentatricopeptide repeat-containing protein n=1 Tax=Acrasis kona TaxID=1008807 RepID=A0AAW2YYL6_9EUKA
MNMNIIIDELEKENRMLKGRLDDLEKNEKARKHRILLGEVAYRIEQIVAAKVLKERNKKSRRKWTVNDFLYPNTSKHTNKKLTEDEEQTWKDIQYEIVAEGRFDGDPEIFGQALDDLKLTRMKDAHDDVDIVTREQLLQYIDEQYQREDQYTIEDAKNLVLVLCNVADNQDYPLMRLK